MSIIIPDPVTTKWVPLGYGASVVPSVPSARVARTAAQACASGAETLVSFDAVRWDTDNIWSAATPTRLTCRTPGKYLVTIGFALASNAAGTRQFGIRNNGQMVKLGNQVGDSRDQNYLPVTTIINWSVGDYITAGIWHNAGVSLNTLTSAEPYVNEIEVCYLGPPILTPTPIPPARTYSSTPPVSPKNGDLWDFPVSSNGEIWTFRYNANSSSAYKWEFVGGSEYMPGYNLSNKCTAGATAVFVPGAAFTLARAGDYIFEWGGNLYDEGAWNHIYLDLYDSTAAAAVQTVAKTSYTSTTNYGAHMSTKHRINSVSAGRQYAMTIRNSNGTANSGGVSIGYISVRPIRVA